MHVQVGVQPTAQGKTSDTPDLHCLSLFSSLQVIGYADMTSAVFLQCRLKFRPVNREYPYDVASDMTEECRGCLGNSDSEQRDRHLAQLREWTAKRSGVQ